MAPEHSSAETLLVAVPMVLLLFAAYFRLDTLWSGPKKPAPPGRRLTEWDEHGVPQCEDPSPTDYSVGRRRY